MKHHIEFFNSQQKAIDQALWLRFIHRLKKRSYGVLRGPEDNYWAVCDDDALTFIEGHFLDILPKNYSEMTYQHLDDIRQDKEPLQHWESLVGAFSTLDGDILRYILFYNVPIHKIIRHELALRGYDEHHRWCGFKKAREIWLK